MVEQSIPTSIGGYVPLRIIGVGASGVVYLAREKLRENNFKAVKVLHHHSILPDAKRQRELADITRRELDGIRQYVNVGRGHPGIIQIDDAAESDGILYYAMELADSANSPPDTSHSLSPQELEAYSPLTLEVIMKRCPVMPPRQALDIVKTMLQALKHLHDQQLIHRDVKPTNIVFVNGQPKLCDFGLLTRMDRDVTQVGTPGYLPNDAVLDQTADLYALGTVLYEMLSGRPRGDYPMLDRRKQLRGQDRVAFNAAVQVMLRATHPEKQSRFQSADEMSTAIAVRVEPYSRRLRQIRWAVMSILVMAGLWFGPNLIPWSSVSGVASSKPVALPSDVMRIASTKGTQDVFEVRYSDGIMRRIRLPDEVEGAVISDCFGGRPALVYGPKAGTPDYGKLVVMHQRSRTSDADFVKTQTLSFKSDPPKAWNFQSHDAPFGVRPLYSGDLDPAPGNELIIALNHVDAFSKLVLLGRDNVMLGSFWHFGWFIGAWPCDVDSDGRLEVICQVIVNKRELSMGKGRKSEPTFSGLLILTLDAIHAASGYWGTDDWLCRGSLVSPIAYGYCSLPYAEKGQGQNFWQWDTGYPPCFEGEKGPLIQGLFLGGQYLEFDSQLRPRLAAVMPMSAFADRTLPPISEMWIQTWPPEDSVKDAPAPRE